MTTEINFKNNPLHGVSLKSLLNEVVDHYGFEILFAYLNINSFKTNPSIASSVKFLKKTDWAREKVEAFYLYEFKNLPSVSSDQFSLSPRDRIVPEDQKPGEPAELSLEDAEQLREKMEMKAASYDEKVRQRVDSGKRYVSQRVQSSDSRENNKTREDRSESSSSPVSAPERDDDPWAQAKKNKRKH